MVEKVVDGAAQQDAIDVSDASKLLMPKERELCTPSLLKFLRRHYAVLNLFFQTMELTRKADELRAAAIRALSLIKPGEFRKELENVEINPRPSQDRFEKFGALQLENINIRAVDNFLSYLSEIIQRAIRRQPKILMSEETVKVEDILRFSRYSDLGSGPIDLRGAI